MNEEGYLQRVSKSAGKPTNSKGYLRDWWLIKAGSSDSAQGIISFKTIRFPNRLTGKRVRIKIELMDDD